MNSVPPTNSTPGRNWRKRKTELCRQLSDEEFLQDKWDVEDSLVLFPVVCVEGFNMCDGCQLVCVVALHVIRHGTREKNQH